MQVSELSERSERAGRLTSGSSAAVVGRGDEVGRLLELVGGAVAGRGAAVLIQGEPGSGKTTLLDVVTAEARRLGVRVLRGAGEERARRLPFAAIGSGLGLHSWPDAEGLGVVAAYRPIPRGEEFDTLIRGLDARGAVPLTLGPLDPPAVAALVEQLAGAPPGPGLLDLVAGAGGNPLYITELVDALTREGRLRIVAGTATLVEGRNVPESLVEAILRRLAFLSSEAREVLRVGAVLAPGFTITELSTVLGTSVMTLWDVVNEALN